MDSLFLTLLQRQNATSATLAPARIRRAMVTISGVLVADRRQAPGD
jgi:hypothetical protein